MVSSIIIIINLFNVYKHLCIYICTNLQLQLIYVYVNIFGYSILDIVLLDQLH